MDKPGISQDGIMEGYKNKDGKITGTEFSNMNKLSKCTSKK
jgi:hypothetical protein